MSIAGRNALRGDLASTYRPTVVDGTGGQQTTSWALVLQDVPLESHAEVTTQMREAFGIADKVEAVVFVPIGTDVMVGDGILWASGPFEGKRFRVVSAPPSRRHRLCGLASTDEVFP